MILDTAQQIPTGSILSRVEGTSHNCTRRTPVPGIPITSPIESRQPPTPFREYKVRSIRKGRGWYKVRVETLGEMQYAHKSQLYFFRSIGSVLKDIKSYKFYRADDKPIGTPLNPLDW